MSKGYKSLKYIYVKGIPEISPKLLLQIISQNYNLKLQFFKSIP